MSSASDAGHEAGDVSGGAPPPADAQPASAEAQLAPPRKRSGRAKLETSAGGVVYRVQDGQPLFLLIRDSYRNWGFPKGHLEVDEQPDAAAVREVREETGLEALELDGEIDTIDWFFRFRGRLVHKVCHFFLMRSDSAQTKPQRAEGITACRWATYDDAARLVSYANARDVLVRANAMVLRQELPLVPELRRS
ncbi:MAG: NUDIX hydrolase [Gemmatimonadaceae bacterium]|nr:NUDIX hydrolase [Gemmatimonadaceae bacterium]